MVLQLCIVFTIGESPRVCSEISYIDLRRRKSSDRTTLVRSRSNYFCRTDNAKIPDALVRSQLIYFANDGQRALSIGTCIRSNYMSIYVRISTDELCTPSILV